MTKNDIKKELYRENPIAYLTKIQKGNVSYLSTIIVRTGESISEYKDVYFIVPIADMGDAEFKAEMDSKLLIRWITTQETETV